MEDLFMEIKNNVQVEATEYVYSKDGIRMTKKEWLEMVKAERDF
jgi:hypothetical protein